jgi:hypothetical protein
MCYDKLLGLRNCSQPQPVTGLYIDDLGISDTLLGQFITDQYNTGYELFEAKRSFAWKKLSSDMLTRLSPMMKADSVIDNKRVGQLKSTYQNLQTSTGNYGGVRLKIQPNRTSFLELFIADITIALPDTETDVPVLVFDMVTGKVIDTFDYAQGGQEQYVGLKIPAKRKAVDIAIVYEMTQDVPKFVPKFGHCYDCNGTVKDAHICPFVDAIGIDLTTDGTTVTTSTNSRFTAGVSVNYNVNCDREAWLCSIGGLMAMPLAYATAVEIYNYALTVSPSQRVNTAVTINRGQKPFATAPAYEGIVAARDIAAEQYDLELKAMLQNMRLPDDRHCFDCRKNIKYVTALP